jgi:signal transduction histidine kinase
MKAGLRNAAQLLDSHTQKLAIDSAINDADDALTTFNALLAMARAEAGVGRDAFAQVDLVQLANDIVELFGPLAEEKDQVLETKTEPATILGQAQLLKQAVGNLVQNAIKFTPAGGHILLRLTRSGDKIQLIVQDNGKGIPAADCARAIKPFGRLTRDENTEGNGLGLALASSFAKLHDGTLRLEAANPGLRAVLEFKTVDTGS